VDNCENLSLLNPTEAITGVELCLEQAVAREMAVMCSTSFTCVDFDGCVLFLPLLLSFHHVLRSL
jgi:hypothetical protein